MSEERFFSDFVQAFAAVFIGIPIMAVASFAIFFLVYSLTSYLKQFFKFFT